QRYEEVELKKRRHRRDAYCFYVENNERYLCKKYLSSYNRLIIWQLHKRSESMRLKYFIHFSTEMEA
uniref:hypothetical protein n=1 Tax=Bacteroides faecis TaxID=674529 RepID=UPI001D071D80